MEHDGPIIQLIAAPNLCADFDFPIFVIAGHKYYSLPLIGIALILNAEDRQEVRPMVFYEGRMQFADSMKGFKKIGCSVE